MRAPLSPFLAVAFFVTASGLGQAQSTTADTTSSEFDSRVFEIVGAVSAERIEEDIRTLVGFGTRHTLLETESETRGIGAARRVSGSPSTREVVNVLTVLRGSTDPSRYLILSGDIDSRISDIFNSTDDLPGTNDNASLAGYKVCWRETTAPQWEHSRFVGKAMEYTLENIIIDNYLFGVAAVDTNGNESVVSFPQRRARRQ